jgi:hypothetical protein
MRVSDGTVGQKCLLSMKAEAQDVAQTSKCMQPLSK